MTPTPKDPVDALMALVDRYWELAYAEGKEGRDHDTEAGEAQATLSAIRASARALAAVPAVEQLSELMRGLEIPPSAAPLSPAALYAIGRAIADQAKSAQQAGGVPAGFVLVPVEPTPEMCAAMDAVWAYGGGSDAGAYRAALADAPSPSAVQPLSEADQKDLERLDELFSDGEGWDLPKERMERLAELGVIRRRTGSLYSMTAFGLYCLRHLIGFPLETVAEFNDRQHQDMLKRAGIVTPKEQTNAM